MQISNLIRRGALVAAAAALPISLLATPAHAAGDAGLYGAGDPTYDGVFRQSQAIIGLASNDLVPPTSAIEWLLGQQCADGSFQAYRADTTAACAKPDPVNFTGPDTNSTGIALMALMALDDNGLKIPTKLMNRIVDAADSAGVWLTKQQNSDGGWPWIPGGKSDANSTGIALGGLMTQAPNYQVTFYKRASRFLGTLSAGCAAGGGYAYQAGGKIDASATAQGLSGLVGPLPAPYRGKVAVAAPCANTAKDKAISYLAKAVAAKGILDSSMGGPDYMNTSVAVMDLVAAGKGRAAVAKGLAALKAHVRDFDYDKNGVDPGAIGLLLGVAVSTGTSPTSFGGQNLVTLLASSLRK